MSENDKEAIQNIIVIVARKSDYLRCLLASLGANLERLRSEEQRDLRQKLVDAIASLEPRLFVSRREIEAGKLSLKTRLEDLDRDALWRVLSRALV